MSGLFPKAMLQAHKLYDDWYRGRILEPEIEYIMTSKGPDFDVTTGASFWDHLCNDPLQGWTLMDMTFASFLLTIEGNILYVGGGSGRFSKWLESHGRECYTIDSSPEAIELMGRRDVECELMDGMDMSFAANSYPVVVIGGDVLDCYEDPTPFIKEAARVASERIVYCGYIREGQTDDKIEYDWSMEWMGETDTIKAYYQHHEYMKGLAEAEGMNFERLRTYLPDESKPDLSWILEMEW